MKSLTKSVVLSLISGLLAPALLMGQGVSTAKVVSETPDGALVVRTGVSMAVDSGYSLIVGDVVKSNNSTLILSLCDGSLLTVYPGTELTVSSMSDDQVELSLAKGEILGDTASGCSIAVDSVVGKANISSGVSGIVMVETGEGWTLQVRNLDANVTFTGDSNLDTSNMAISIVSPGEDVNVAAGDEMIVRGTYDADVDVFALVSGGAVMAMMSDQTVGELREDAQEMVSVGRPAQLPAIEEVQETPAEKAVPVLIDIPWKDVETASGKG